MKRPADHSQCRVELVDGMAEMGVEVTASAAPPLVLSPYGVNSFRCPHGTRYYLEPTSEQIAAWTRDDVR